MSVIQGIWPKPINEEYERQVAALKRDCPLVEIDIEKIYQWGGLFVAQGTRNDKRIIYLRAATIRGLCGKFREAYAVAESGGLLK